MTQNVHPSARSISQTVRAIALLALCVVSVSGRADGAPRVVPGPQPGGAVLLHNQWPIRPVGAQISLGDFPVNLAVEPGGDYAAILHAGYGAHNIELIDLRTRAPIAVVPIHEAFGGIAFSSDGHRLVCSGGSDAVLHVFKFDRGRLTAAPDARLSGVDHRGVVCGVALARGGRTAYASVLFQSKVYRVDLDAGTVVWSAALDPAPAAGLQPGETVDEMSPYNDGIPEHLRDQSDPFGIAIDEGHHRIFVSLWGRSDVAVLDSDDGRILARWPVGLHPNEVVLSRDGKRLFVSNGGRNSVTVLDTATGEPTETLNSAFSASDPPGSTPDSLSLSRNGKTLFVANARNNNIAVFDVGDAGHGRALGFIPTGWFPSSIRVSPDGRMLLVVSARGLVPVSNGWMPAPGERQPERWATVRPVPGGPKKKFPYIGGLYHGSLAVIELPERNEADQTWRRWTAIAELCRPAAPAAAAADNPVPARLGDPSPIRYVIYVIKENRTYDEVFGDMTSGNGDPALCLFPEQTTPNLHKLAREFVLLDNFYAEAEVSASGHEWTVGGYSSEFVEKLWPLQYGHKGTHAPYPGEGGYAAAVPALGYLWNQAQAAGVSYRDFGEFVHGYATADHPAYSDLPALKDHVDPLYRGWDIHYSDLDRVSRFVSELRRFEAAGEMPRLQIVRLPNDHTEAAVAGALSPRALVAQNDLAFGRLVDAVSHSRFWPQTAIFVVEDDAQNGPDHVDAHRTEALIVSPFVRRHSVDSTPYTTCSMLATLELILGMRPMSQFDNDAAPMRASFRAQADLAPYGAVPNQVRLDERNPPKGPQAALSANFDFSREDAIDDQTFNRVLWAAVRGENNPMPAPVHAAFVRQLPAADDD